MEVQQLKFFVTVANEQNLTRASVLLHTVQSNVTAKIKQLETELGRTLFERSKKGMFLTEHGEMLLPHAQKIIEKEHDIKQLMANDTIPSGSLAIACLDTFARLYLGRVIPAYVKRFKEVNLELQTGFNTELTQLLADGKADLIGIVGEPRKKNQELVAQFSDQLILMSKDKNIEDQPILIMSKECVFGQTLDTYFDHKRKVLKITSIESIINSIAAGIGISLLPEKLVDSLKGTKNLTKTTIGVRCDYSLVRRKNKPWSTAEKEFIALLQSEHG